ncbi:ComEA family DNA-binding protein [Streptomyces sp. NPDC050658]|uniref:ComEA family DNA-binding protein n=1 Tax=unclassified Streptomyces TaxID=2593676 RepID=UPI003415D652
MALRSLSRTQARTRIATSGPGRGAGSDGRLADGRGSYGRARRRAARRRQASAEAMRLRAESMFAPSASASASASTSRSTPAPAYEPEPEPEAVARGAPPGEEAAAPLRERAGLAVRERLPLWLQLRCGIERRSLVALAVVLVVAAVFAAQHFWSGRTQSVRAPEVVRAASDGEARPSPSPGPPPGPPVEGGAAGAGGGIVVDVSGKVRSPGILKLPAGSRVADALKAAGGVRPGADTDGLNRARLLIDGEQVVVGAPATAPAVPGGGTAAGPPGASPAAPVGLNTATAEQLDGLPGVGPVLAQHIIDYRTEHGGFRSVDELREVNGIGDRRFADLQNLVRP